MLAFLFRIQCDNGKSRWKGVSPIASEAMPQRANWSDVKPFFLFPLEIGRVFFTINAILGLGRERSFHGNINATRQKILLPGLF